MKTLRDVARRAGVTATTVSRVINNRANVSERTRKKVLEAMAELEYTPNELARGLSRRQSMTIGVIMPNTIHPYFAQILNAIEVRAGELGYRVMLCYASAPSPREADFYTMLKRRTLDAVIAISRTPTAQAQFGRDMNEYPIVFLDNVYRGENPLVIPNNYQGGKLAARHLIEVGCRKILHIAGDKTLPETASMRTVAFEQVCASLGHPYQLAYTTEEEFAVRDYHKSIEKALSMHPDIDGIFAYNDIIAVQCINLLAARGRIVPRDVKVVGFDDIDIAQWYRPSITTIHLPARELGEMAAQIAVDKIHGRPVPSTLRLDTHLVVRETTGRT